MPTYVVSIDPAKGEDKSMMVAAYSDEDGMHITGVWELTNDPSTCRHKFGAQDLEYVYCIHCGEKGRKPVRIIARTHAQAEYYTRHVFKLCPSEWRYVSETNRIYGIKDATIIVLNDWFLNDNYSGLGRELDRLTFLKMAIVGNDVT